MEGRPHDLNADARRTLELLHEHINVSVASLRGEGVVQPAQALYALQLAGWPVRRSGSFWRLVDESEPPPAKPAPKPRVRRVARER